MKLHRMISYSLLTAGAIGAAKAVFSRWQWDEVNVHAAIMLDWDDVEAVATRTAGVGVGALLCRYRESGATHLSIPELTLNRLLQNGTLAVVAGADAGRVYLQAGNAAIAGLVVAELQARLPHIQAAHTRAKKPVISFAGNLPAVAEVGLGFNPAHADLARQAGLQPVARPLGYSWVQPEMIERTLGQAAALGVKLVAFQGNLIPGHEFNLQTTVEVMRGHGLRYAFFRESRHQKGDWFLAKNLAADGLVVLAHEFEPEEMLAEDWHTISYRWANLAVEAGVRLCSVRFFRILHAADPLESVAYVQELAAALKDAGFELGHAASVDLSAYQPARDPVLLAFGGLSTAGAAGLAADLLPLPDSLKLAGIGASALALTGLPFASRLPGRAANHHHHHDDHHHHGGHHHHPPPPATAYAPKGLSLAASVLYPAAAAAIGVSGPLTAAAHTLTVAAAAAPVLNATATETDYLLGIEEYRGFNLDWLAPLGLAMAGGLAGDSAPNSTKPEAGWRYWLAVAGLVLAGLAKNPAGDLPARFDREHRHPHTHHLSAFQRHLGDFKMALSPAPLRKWSLLAPLGGVAAAWFQRRGRRRLSAVALAAAAAGQVATLTGFRNGQRPFLTTLSGRAKGWATGLLLAGLFWLVAGLFSRNR